MQSDVLKIKLNLKKIALKDGFQQQILAIFSKSNFSKINKEAKTKESKLVETQLLMLVQEKALNSKVEQCLSLAAR